jgi:demethoxyubiquinone hydroxylase (CLK1/Coq7/Cat5 family)
MSAAQQIKKRTEFFIKDLHAREIMRLGWYRQVHLHEERVRLLRERKARHTAFLLDLLRRRGVGPAWYARWFYLAGHAFGMITALLPQAWASRIERRLEHWLMIRYERYLQEMTLDSMMRTMVESLQLQRLGHNEPGHDALQLISSYLREQEKSLDALV